MLPEKRLRRWRGPLFSLLLLVFLDLASGTLIFRFAPYKIDNRFYRMSSPLYHHDLKPNVSAWASWGPNRHRIYTNSLGFKDAAVRDIPTSSDARRVVLLGDSFTEGMGYAYEDTFAGILHARLAPRGIDVLNAGVASYSPVIYYRKLKYLIEEASLDVDEVVVFLDISDIQDEAQLYTLSGDGRVLDQPSRPGNAADVAELPATSLEWLKCRLREHSLLVAAVDRLKDRILGRTTQQPVEQGAGPLDPWLKVLKNDRANWTHDAIAFAAYGERGMERATRSMELLSDLMRSHGTPLTVVVYPWPNQIAQGDRDSKQVQHWRTWAAEHEAGFVDLFGEFIDGRDPAVSIRAYYLEGDSHFNAAGHQRMAAAMLQRHQWAARR